MTWRAFPPIAPDKASQVQPGTVWRCTTEAREGGERHEFALVEELLTCLEIPCAHVKLRTVEPNRQRLRIQAATISVDQFERYTKVEPSDWPAGERKLNTNR